MKKKKVIVITDSDHPNIDPELDAIRETNEFTIRLEQCKTGEDVIARCQDADGLINQYVPLTKDVLKSLPNCKVITKYGVGYDNVDVDAAAELGIQVCNVPDYGVEEVADHAIALTFNLLRKINLLANSVKNNQWKFQISAPIHRLSTLTIGVVGLGRIGRAYANKAKALGWNVIGYHKRKVDGIEQVSLEELCRRADVVSIHIPLNEETHYLFDEKLFSIMKPSAFIVNTSRGAVINEKHLEKAIEQKRIAGAALDVLETEPPEKDHPLFKFDEVIITPHAAFYSEEAYYDMKRKAAEEAITYLKHRQIRYPVNSPE